MQCERVNMDNYRFYLLARVQCFKSSEWDCSSLIHSSSASIGPKMETLMVAPLVMVTLMMMSPFLSKLVWVVDLILAQ
jgi:hypothetical protein